MPRNELGMFTPPQSDRPTENRHGSGRQPSFWTEGGSLPEGSVVWSFLTGFVFCRLFFTCAQTAVLFRWLKIEGSPWFRWLLFHLPGRSIFPLEATYACAYLVVSLFGVLLACGFSMENQKGSQHFGGFVERCLRQ